METQQRLTRTCPQFAFCESNGLSYSRSGMFGRRNATFPPCSPPCPSAPPRFAKTAPGMVPPRSPARPARRMDTGAAMRLPRCALSVRERARRLPRSRDQSQQRLSSPQPSRRRQLRRGFGPGADPAGHGAFVCTEERLAESDTRCALATRDDRSLAPGDVARNDDGRCAKRGQFRVVAVVEAARQRLS